MDAVLAMKVGWLVDNPGYIGGAEMTQAEFRAAAPEGVEVVDCPPGAVDPNCSIFVIHNCVHYSMADLDAIGEAPSFKYCHDVYPDEVHPGVKQEVLATADLIFCSPLQRDRMGLEGECVPPPLDLDRFKAPEQKRTGACSIAQWRNPGKGAQYVAEWAKENGPVDVYGDGDFLPQGPGINYCGPVSPERVPQTLWAYRQFVFLPFQLEPFGRAVVEASAAGCELVVNGNVGALYWLEERPEALRTASVDFWAVVLGD